MAMLRRWACVAVAGLVAGSAAYAQSDSEFSIAIKNHRFVPAEVKIPANKRVKLIVHNQDTTPEEFESHTLKREKVIPGGAKATILLGPLKPGRYTFFGEFHESTAQGAVVVE